MIPHGETTKAHDITWTVKFDFEEINRQENDLHIASSDMSQTKSWDNTFSPVIFFQKFLPDSYIQQMVDNYNHQQYLITHQPSSRNNQNLRNYATIINITDMKFFGVWWLLELVVYPQVDNYRSPKIPICQIIIFCQFRIMVDLYLEISLILSVQILRIVTRNSRKMGRILGG